MFSMKNPLRRPTTAPRKPQPVRKSPPRLEELESRRLLSATGFGLPLQAAASLTPAALHNPHLTTEVHLPAVSVTVDVPASQVLTPVADAVMPALPAVDVAPVADLGVKLDPATSQAFARVWEISITVETASIFVVTPVSDVTIDTPTDGGFEVDVTVPGTTDVVAPIGDNGPVGGLTPSINVPVDTSAVDTPAAETPATPDRSTPNTLPATVDAVSRPGQDTTGVPASTATAGTLPLPTGVIGTTAESETTPATVRPTGTPAPTGFLVGEANGPALTAGQTAETRTGVAAAQEQGTAGAVGYGGPAAEQGQEIPSAGGDFGTPTEVSPEQQSRSDAGVTWLAGGSALMHDLLAALVGLVATVGFHQTGRGRKKKALARKALPQS